MLCMPQGLMRRTTSLPLHVFRRLGFKIWCEITQVPGGCPLSTAVDDHILAMDMYMAAVPHILSNSRLLQPTLWHPMTRLDDIYINETGPRTIQSIIRWRGAWAAPYCFQDRGIPSCFVYSGPLDVPSGMKSPTLNVDPKSLPKEALRFFNQEAKLVRREKIYTILQNLDASRGMEVADWLAGLLWAFSIEAPRSWICSLCPILYTPTRIPR